MENEINKVEKFIINNILGFILVNKIRLYIIITFGVILYFLSRLPYFNLVLTPVVRYGVMLVITALIFNISGLKIYTLFILLLFVMIFLTLFKMTAILETISSIAYIICILAVLKIVSEYREQEYENK